MNTTVTERGRFSPVGLFVAAALAAALVIGVVWKLAERTGVLTLTNTYVGADGKQVVESSFALATARFAVIAMLTLGALAVLAGLVVTLAEMTLRTTTVQGETEVAPAVEVRGVEAITGTAAAAIGVVVAKIVEALGTALKDLKAGVALMLVGTVMMITGGLVAWNTIPGTDTNPTITIENQTTTTTPEPTPTSEPTSTSEPDDASTTTPESQSTVAPSTT